MERKTVIIHGWSDSSKSFEGMKRFLIGQKLGDVRRILYADYESREDHLTFNDVADGLHDRFIEAGLIDVDGAKRCDLDVVVHSTGGLVIRHWIWRYYLRDGDRLERCPVRRLVMLAPANFGSPLAHRGKSFLGSLVKGRKGLPNFLEVGRRILSGLELASPYQWWLAENDLFAETPPYHPERIQTTILVGDRGYSGLRSFVNQVGTDGTVVISGTQLSSVKLLLDPLKPLRPGETRRPYDWVWRPSAVETAFGVLAGVDHGSIVGAFDGGRPEETAVGRWLLAALRAPDADAFRGLAAGLRAETAATRRAGDPEQQAYQQFVVHAIDDQGVSIDDFTLEFFVRKATKATAEGRLRPYRASAAEQEHSEELQRLLTAEAHTHTQDASYRRFLVGFAEVQRRLAAAARDLRSDVVLGLRVHVPPVDRGIYYQTDRLEDIVLAGTGAADDASGAWAPRFLFPDTTTLVQISVDRANRYVWVGPEARRH